MRKTVWTVVVASCLLTLLAAASATAATTQVHIAGGAPNPAEVTIDEGDTVTFFNDDNVEHRIFALGQDQSGPIAPGSSLDVGPFQTGGQGGRFDYRVDQNGPAGAILVREPATSPTSSTTSTTKPTTTTAKPTTTSTTSTTTSTSTTVATTATTDTTTTTTTAVPVAQSDAKKKDSTNILAVLGVALLVAGIGGLIVAMQRSRRRSASR